MGSHEQDRFQQALDHHQAGRLRDAATMYKAILSETPDRADVLYLLGAIAHQTGYHEQAVDIVRRALSVDADRAECHNLLGLDLMALGRPSEAEACFRRAIAIENSSEYLNNLGILWKEQGRLDEAVGAFAAAVAQSPDYAVALYNLGNAWRAKQDAQSAEECFRKALDRDPQHAHSAAALGQVLIASGRAEEALVYLERAAQSMPGDAELHCDLGDALQATGQFGPAVEAYRRALGRNPNLSRAWYSAGCAEAARIDHAAAMECFRRALALNPDWPQAQHNLGKAVFHLGLVEEALALFRRAAAGGEPALPEAAIATIIPGSPTADHAAVLETRRSWAVRHLPSRRTAPAMFGGGSHARIGYISSFFQDHNWMKPVWGLIHHHDRTRFEVHLFSDTPASRIEHGYRPHPQDRFHDIAGLSNEEAYEYITAERIDLLVDLNSYSAVGRLPLIAAGPARVTVAWFNLYATSGIESYDYLIGDDVVIRPEEEPFYCERIARVPGSYLTFEVDYPTPPVSELPCTARGAITFGCLASQYKITDETIEAWSAILLGEPGSTLFLKNRALGAAGAREFMLGRFARCGVPPERIRMEGPSDHYRFLEAYSEIDIALDTFPYNGGTTTTEAIWQGVPVVTFVGDRWVSRTSASILEAGGLGEFVGKGRDDYALLAIELAKSPERLRDLRATMRSRLRESPVCDTATFAAKMEELYMQFLQQRQ